MKLLFFLIVFVTITGSCYSQENNTAQVEGKVMDSSKQAVGNVNIFLLKPDDSLLVKLGITDNLGNFLIRGIQPGNYLLALSKEGYKKQYLQLAINESKVVVPTVILLDEVKNLLGVTVTSRRSLVEQTGDKIIYNVENDPLALLQTAVDLLRKTPMVTVDGQGTIQVNGQTNFKVLLNGRETSMFAHNANEALKSFPGSLIKKIEVITNPSAKYDGEGPGGMINIITKKKVAGYNGTLTAAAATSDGSSTVNRILNLKYGKFGVSSYLLTSNNSNQKIKTFEEIESLDHTAFYKRISNGNSLNNDSWKSGNLELSYELDSLHIFSSYFLFGSSVNKFDGVSLLDLILPNLTDTVKSTYTSSADKNYSDINAGLDYLQKFKGNREKEFSIRLNGDFGNDNAYSTSIQNSSLLNRYIVNDSKALNREYTIQTDYIQPMNKGSKLELGAKAIIRRATSDYQSLIKYTASENYKVDRLNTDYFTYNQDVYSLYATSHFKIGKVTFRAGMRMEHTVLSGDFLSSTARVDQNYFSFLPNLQVSTKYKNGHTLSFSYGMRLARPYIWNLNPFVNDIDSLNVSKGNPALQPQSFHTFSLQYTFTSGQTFISLGLSNSFSNDRIIQFSAFNDVTGVITSSPTNIGRNNQTALSINFSEKFNPKWAVNVNGWLAYDIIQNTTGLGSRKNNGFSGNGLFNSIYKITGKLTSSANAGFNLSAPTLQVNYRIYVFYGIGFNYKLMKDKLTITASAKNLLNRDDTMPKNVFEDNNFRRTSASSYPDRTLNCSVSWSFGKLSENVSKKRGVHNDDLLGK